MRGDSGAGWLSKGLITRHGTGHQALAEVCEELGMTIEAARVQIIQKFSLSAERADDCMEHIGQAIRSN